MPLSGPRSPVTGANNTGVGTVAWTSPGNITAYDDVYASAALDNQTTNYVFATDFGFTIPDNATIDGIRVDIERHYSGADAIRDSRVHLIKNGRVLSSADNKPSGTDWSTASAFPQYTTYGSISDVWGGVWTPADINAYDFGVALAAVPGTGGIGTAFVDHIRVWVQYTDGYQSAPQVQETGQVFLMGRVYRLANERDGSPGKIRLGIASQFPPKMVTRGEYTVHDNPIVSTLFINDLRGGMGVFRYSYDPQTGLPREINSFWTGENIWTLHGGITLGPLRTGLGTPDTTTATAHQIARHTSDTLLVYVTRLELYNYNWATPAWGTVIDTLPSGVISPPVFANGRLFYALADSGYSYHTSAGAVATDVTTPTFADFIKWDNKLYGIDVDGILYSSPNDGVAGNMGNSGNWTTLAAIPNEWDVLTSINEYYDLEIYENAGGEPTIYCRTSNGLWAYDAVTDKWFQTNLTFPRSGLQSAMHGALGLTYRGSLFCQAGLRDIYIYTAGSPATVDTAHLGAPDGLPAKYLGEIHAWAKDNQLMYVLLGDSWENATVNHAIFVYNGLGWHPIVSLTNPDYTWGSAEGKRPPGSLVAIAMNSKFYLFADIGGATGATNNTISWFDLQELEQPPLVSTTRTYAASGDLELPWFSGGLDDDDKTALHIHLRVVGASADETVQIAYRIDGSTGSYTNLGSAITTSEPVTVYFGTNREGLVFKDIQFRLSLARGSTTTNRPFVEYFSFSFIKNMKVQRRFSFVVDASSQSPDGRSQQEQLDHLWAHISAGALGTFAYRDDRGNTRSYLVKVLPPLEGIEDTGYRWSGLYTVNLAEFGEN